MKKSIAILLSLCTILALCACGGTAVQPEVPAQNDAQQPAADAQAEVVTQETAEPEPEPVDYSGTYTDDGYNYVTVEKDGDGYRMEVSLYRLTTLDEGTVTVTDGGLVFHTFDANGEPMTVSFHNAGESGWELRIDDSTWPLLDTGTVFRGLQPGTIWEETVHGSLLYMGHASLRITTPEEMVIYIDPYVGDYSVPADLILITHDHYDHNNAKLVVNRNPGCEVITWKEALAGGEHHIFDLGYVTVEAVEAGYNKNHNVKQCVGYILTLSDGIKIYVSGDTSTTEQMPELAAQNIDYAFFCCDGQYNMDVEEAIECARLVGAKYSIPYHMIVKDGKYFDLERAELFEAPGRLIIADGEEIELSGE